MIGAARRLAIAGLAGLLLAATFGVGSAGAAAYDRFYANFAGEELMRAMNADRVALGLPAYATDSTLEGIARDRALTCPSDKSLVIRGRARDMADRNYLSHSIKGCRDASGGAFDTFDLLHAFGYTFAAAAENIADNNYPASATTYKTGCSLSASTCHASITLPWTVAVAERGFMSSSSHRASILSTSYTRFGCAAWTSSTGYHYYACYFIRSGNGRLDTAGPGISSASGIGATFKTGSTPTFTATASDGLSLLSDGYVYLDGKLLRGWAWDHAGLSASLAATVPALTVGTHTLTWWVRDASTRAGSLSFQFKVAG
ncbi:MAG TPA: CAP domain-containing protein [Candidatus Limnocylindrales bacterium]|nr:CAP domain-containing protein [Candidatus Limnocylindrales bacterium]